MMSQSTTKQLEADFHNRMLSIHERAKAECNYNATRFRSLVLAEGGLQAAKQLLSANQYSEGLTRLWEEGRLDISLEAAVLEEMWKSLFTEEELETAKQRLNELGYQT
jgi:hypothetical protein